MTCRYDLTTTIYFHNRGANREARVQAIGDNLAAYADGGEVNVEARGDQLALHLNIGGSMAWGGASELDRHLEKLALIAARPFTTEYEFEFERGVQHFGKNDAEVREEARRHLLAMKRSIEADLARLDAGGAV